MTTEKSKRPIVGCNRWDGCWEGSRYIKAISEKKWHHLLPFYAKIMPDGEIEARGDTQEVMDQEIAFAKKNGLDYWAFDYLYDPSSDPKTNYGLKLYLTSKYKADINFALILMGAGFRGPKEDWAKAEDDFIRYFKEPTYQMVLGGRPLLYVFYVESMPGYFGSDQAVKEALNSLRRRSEAAELQAPYIVAQVWSAQSGVEAIEKLGFDAINAYTWVDNNLKPKEYPYRVLTESIERFWESCKATGRPVIPIVSSGFDNRPLRGPDKQDIYPGAEEQPWYTEPTPKELAEHLRSAIEWTKQNQKAVESNVIYIYAWFETGEGGRIMPTLYEGAARLEAMGKVLK